MPVTDEAQREDRQRMIAAMAEKAGVTPERMMEAIRRRVAKEAQTPDLLLFLHTANTYGLDPLATPPQIALFVPKNKEGGVPKPYVTFDGWLRILISHPRYYNHGWKDDVWSGGQRGKGSLDAITFWIDRFEPKHAKHAEGPCDCERDVFEHVELLAECREKGDYTPWNKWPVRMLKEKAAMQGTRFAFGMYVPDLDDVRQAETFETARAEGAAATTEGADRAQGPIAPAAAIPGAKRARKKAEPAALPEPSIGQTIADLIEPTKEPILAVAQGEPVTLAGTSSLPSTEGEDSLRRASSGPGAGPTASPAPLFPKTPAPTERAALPAHDPAAIQSVDEALEKAESSDGLFDDIL